MARGHGVQCCSPSEAPLSAKRGAAVRGDAAAWTTPRCAPGSTWRDMRVPGDGRLFEEGVDGRWVGRRCGCIKDGKDRKVAMELKKK